MKKVRIHKDLDIQEGEEVELYYGKKYGLCKLITVHDDDRYTVDFVRCDWSGRTGLATYSTASSWDDGWQLTETSRIKRIMKIYE